MAVGERQRHRHLAIVLFAKLPAILPRHPDRVPSLLGKAGVVDDPRLDQPRTLNRRQNRLVHLGQHPLVRPAALADKMQQRLVLRRRPRRRRHCCHRLHALALTRQHQPRVIITQRTDPILMAVHTCKTLHIGRKPSFTANGVDKNHISAPSC